MHRHAQLTFQTPTAGAGFTQVGVFAEPEITATSLTANDLFVVFATDGVWEFLESKWT